MAKFCVIGPKCGRHTSETDRKWFDNREDAVAHAKGLVRGHYRDSSRSTTAIVVQVTDVVEIGMPEVSVRQPETVDFLA